MASSPLDSRANRLLRASRDTFDVVVVGGGAFGVAAARSAASRGLRTLLLEGRDFSAGTSSRSSKLLHGGVRYLEQGDVSLVFEALAERSIMLQAAPHVSRASRFLFPIIPHRTRPLWQVRFGLHLYDLLARFAVRKRHITSLPSHTLLGNADAACEQLRAFGLNPAAVLEYSDGQVDDARVVVESALDAELLGATVLNHARVEAIRGDAQRGWQIIWRDTCSQVVNESFTRTIVNASGAAVAKVHALIEPWPSSWPLPQLTRGTHLLFDVALKLPPLILPTGEAGRYYFVLPHFSPGREATLVGTTDVGVADGAEGETPSQHEVDELLGYLARDLPRAGLTASSLFSRYAGTRVLVARNARGKTSRLRRSELFLERQGYVTVLGGKYTTARLIGERLVDRIERQLGRSSPVANSTAGRVLPGGDGFDRNNLRSTLSQAIGAGAEAEIDRAIARFGSRTLQILEFMPDVQAVSPTSSPQDQFYRAQIRYAICVEQALEVDDVIDRRLSLWPTAAERADAVAIIEEEFHRLGLHRTAPSVSSHNV